MATTTFHLEKSVIASGNIGALKALKKYWNQPVSDIDEKSSAAKYTVLQMAIMMNKKKVVEYLLPQQDLDLNTKATDGTTALMTAVDQGVPFDWIQAMLERGARESINDEDDEGRTALDRCEKGSKIYELLIGNGAKPRPEKPPTPPPELVIPLSSFEETKHEQEQGAPAIRINGDAPPGLDDHPGFWSSMCGCGGRSHKTEVVAAPIFM